MAGRTWGFGYSLATRSWEVWETFSFGPLRMLLIGQVELRKFCKNLKIADLTKIAHDCLTFSMKIETRAIRPIWFRMVVECDTSNLLANSQTKHTPLLVLGNFRKWLIFHFNQFWAFFSHFDWPISHSHETYIESNLNRFVGNPILYPTNSMRALVSVVLEWWNLGNFEENPKFEEFWVFFVFLGQ